MMLKNVLLKIVRSRFLGDRIGWFFEHLEPFIPFPKLICTKYIVAFHHPQPITSLHIVLVPSKKIPTLFHLRTVQNCEYWMANILEDSTDLRNRFRIPLDNYTLLANGGSRQEVRQLHFHFLRDYPVATPLAAMPTNPIHQEALFALYYHPQPNWEIHWVGVVSVEQASRDFRLKVAEAIILALDIWRAQLTSPKQGFSLVIQQRSDFEESTYTFHLCAGKRLA